MSIILFDNALRKQLYPFSLTKAVAAFRFGMMTMAERWELLTRQSVSIHTVAYLQPFYPQVHRNEHIWIDASVLPSEQLVASIMELEAGCCLTDMHGLVAGRGNFAFEDFHPATALSLFAHAQPAETERISHPWQLMQWNDRMIRADMPLVTGNRFSSTVSATNHIIHPENVFVEEGARMEYCTINAGTGPVYIGRNTELMEGSFIRGPFVMGEGAVLKMNSRVYGATSLGPYCTGGGEIKNSVMMGYSNKGHDGYLGDAVIGEWCNLGAGTSNSNVKNTAGIVKVWDYASKSYIAAGQKCGVIMGDYSRTAINSSINTGTMIGVCSNVFGAGLLPTIIDHFTWGSNGKYEFDKAITAIENWKKLKGHHLHANESSMLAYIFENHYPAYKKNNAL